MRVLVIFAYFSVFDEKNIFPSKSFFYPYSNRRAQADKHM